MCKLTKNLPIQGGVVGYSGFRGEYLTRGRGKFIFIHYTIQNTHLSPFMIYSFSWGLNVFISVLITYYYIDNT